MGHMAFGGGFRCKFRCMCGHAHEKHDTFAPLQFVATCHRWEAAPAPWSLLPTSAPLSLSRTPCSHLSTTPCPWHIRL